MNEAAAQLSGADQRRWLDRLELEHDDIRAVLDRAVAQPDPPVAIGVAFSMWRFWQKHGHLAEARARLEAMEAAPWSKDDPRLRARLLEALGGTLWWQGKIPEMGLRYEEALALWESIGDEQEIANAHYNASFQHAVPRGAAHPGRPGRRRERRPRPISRRRWRSIAGSAIGAARRTRCGRSGTTTTSTSRPATASSSSGRRWSIFREFGDRTMEAWSLHMLGTSLLRHGELDRGPDGDRGGHRAISWRPGMRPASR